jgi:radical SAM superfamily enzyme YgiQ (UPF0313 family)
LISGYQKKPIELLERELDLILSLWNKPFIEFADDNTFVSKSWGKDVARLMQRRPVRWFTETDISVADDLELLDSLADAGCAQLLIGLESVNAPSLYDVDSRQWKWKQAESYRTKIEEIQSRGISVNGCFVLGFDHDDEHVFERTSEFIRELDLTEAQVTILTPFPGTALYQRLAKEGRLLEPRFWERCTLFDVTFEPERMSSSELTWGFRELVRSVYSYEAVGARRSAFRKYSRRARRQKEAG